MRTICITYQYDDVNDSVDTVTWLTMTTSIGDSMSQRGEIHGQTSIANMHYSKGPSNFSYPFTLFPSVWKWHSMYSGLRITQCLPDLSYEQSNYFSPPTLPCFLQLYGSFGTILIVHESHCHVVKTNKSRHFSLGYHLASIMMMILM